MWQNLFDVPNASYPNVTEIKLVKLLETMHKEEYMRFRTPLFMALKIQDLETIHCLLLEHLNHQQTTKITVDISNCQKKQNLMLVDLLMKMKWEKTWPNSSGIAFAKTPENIESLKLLLNYILTNYPSNSFEERFNFLYKFNNQIHIWPNSATLADLVTIWDKNEFQL